MASSRWSVVAIVLVLALVFVAVPARAEVQEAHEVEEHSGAVPVEAMAELQGAVPEEEVEVHPEETRAQAPHGEEEEEEEGEGIAQEAVEAEPTAEQEAAVEEGEGIAQEAVEAEPPAEQEVAVEEGEGIAQEAVEAEESKEELREDLVKNLKKAIEKGNVKVYVQNHAVKKETGVDIGDLKGDRLDTFERDNHFVVGVSSSTPVLRPDSTSESWEGFRRVVVTNFEGVKLECRVPVVQQVEAPADEGEDDGTPEEDDEVVDAEAAFEKRVRNLLGDATVNDCHKKADGWWTYELCPLTHIRQYHSEHNVILSSYNLGTFNANRTMESFMKKGQRTLQFVYDEGTKCDLTGMNRKTIVNFSCSPTQKDSLKTVTETSSCQYLVEFASASLCSHKEFQQKEANIHNINCNPIATS
ncbi:PRKCSH domain-containing protein [Chloropicon primus]|uniref:MRH domain-containing protein n=1 Tax=Chloropicon primus TaxID=1764295 RepID=A0A5B8MD00_9CHLO|nr:hypothetical protein A3770_01p09340 [Chloropicon primus]UPQ97626.1 PRKCSH domain-containing protein [Chloropicon primus]|eukprot:QDZ18416.1 hypothetical protein A3770_01p09340 [Chloropicon primus]